MTEQLNVQQMAQRLMTADNILILCHKNPDGDTIGCGSALYCALKALDKNVAVLCSDAIPNRYAFTNAHMFKGEFEPQTVVSLPRIGLKCSITLLLIFTAHQSSVNTSLYPL